jgi:hypothetical protein
VSSDPTGDIGAAVEAAFSASSPDAMASAESSTPAPASAAPTQTDQAAPPSQTPQEEFGPVPYQRFREVNEKAKLTASELQQLQWAKQIQAEHAPEIVRFYQRVRENPLTLLDEVEHLLTRPDTAPAVRSWAARTLGTRVASQPTEAEVEPQPDIQLEDGRSVYSAQQQAKREQWLEQRWLSKVEDRLKPYEQDRQLTQQERADRLVEKMKIDSREHGKQEVEALKQKPYFDRLKGKIAEILTEDKDLKLSTQEAYAQAFIELIVPELSAGKAATLQQKVGASSANPSRPSGAAAAPAKDFREALEREFQIR